MIIDIIILSELIIDHVNLQKLQEFVCIRTPLVVIQEINTYASFQYSLNFTDKIHDLHFNF